MLNFQYKGISQGKYVEGEIQAINKFEIADIVLMDISRGEINSDYDKGTRTNWYPKN